MTYDPAGAKVTLATLHRTEYAASYVESLMRMAVYDRAHGQHLFHMTGMTGENSVLPIWGSTGELAHARNIGASLFLQSEADWLLWVDSDMGWAPDALETLLAAADPEERPMVGGLCFIEQELARDFRGGLRSKLSPTVYDWAYVEADDHTPASYRLLPRLDYQKRNEWVQRVAATGTGFLLTHRSVFEKISAWCRQAGIPENIWYQRIQDPSGDLSGEDVSFCMRARQVDVPIHVHTGVHITHQKTVWWSELDYDGSDRRSTVTERFGLRILEPWEWPKLGVNPNAVEDARTGSQVQAKAVELASEPTAIIVPVMRRPQSAKPFMDSLRASLRQSGTPAEVTVYAVCDQTDRETRAAWLEAGAIAILGQWFREETDEEAGTTWDVPRPGRFSEKANEGYVYTGQHTNEPWLFFVGDDVRFHAGWLDQAQDAGRRSGKGIIGTNDLGNQFVINGQHATHWLARRTYLDQQGGGWDGPGVACHEGYGHWYVDNEVVTAAKQRDEWVPCLESIVEHLHPVWGKGDQDEVYAQGQSTQQADMRLFMERYRQSGKPAAFGPATTLTARGMVKEIQAGGEDA